MKLRVGYWTNRRDMKTNGEKMAKGEDLRTHHGVYANDFSMLINQRASAIAAIQSCICLDVCTF
jgi:hypothetical protein